MALEIILIFLGAFLGTMTGTLISDNIDKAHKRKSSENERKNI